MNKNIKKKLIRAITVCLLITVLLSLASCARPISNNNKPNPQQETDSFIDVPVFATDVEFGKKITVDKVTTKKINSKAVSDTMVTDVNEVVGKYATVALFAGDYAYKGKLSSKKPVQTAEMAEVEKTRSKYVDVSQFIEPNSGNDVAAALQKLIDENKNRTIYFPDGEYLISKPLQTSGAATESTAFYLSDNAVIKASNDWKGGDDALIKLGISNKNSNENNIVTAGSNYHFIGGTLDGNGKARGISLLSGRESLVSKVKIINTTIGIYVAEGVNSKSSDMDIEDIDIVGIGGESKGLVVEAHDNTFSDIRISNVKIGVDAKLHGNFYRNVSVRLDYDVAATMDYENTVAFSCYDSNWFNSCSSENMATAFLFNDKYTPSSRAVVKDFSIRWTEARTSQTAFKAIGPFTAYCSNGIIDFFDASTENSILIASGDKTGTITDVIAETDLCDEVNYKSVFVNSQVKGAK